MKLLSSDSDPYPPCIKPHLFAKITKVAGLCTPGSCSTQSFQMADIREQAGSIKIKRHKKDGIVYDDPIPQSYIIKNALYSIFPPYPE